MEGLVEEVFVPSVMSAAVKVKLPDVLKVTLRLCVPAANAVSEGRDALASVAVMRTVSVMVLTRFQFASTALTVTLKAVPAVRAVGVPVFPRLEPGEAVSPGT